MPKEKTTSSKLAPPHCPGCAQTMRLARKTRRFNGLRDLYVFECQKCDISRTEEGGAPSERESAVEIGSWYLDEFGNPTREIKRRD
jgi:transposase-like protein